MDPYAVLGVSADASDEEVVAAYRELAKHLHPDVAGGARAHAAMARLNAALEAIRARDDDVVAERRPGPVRDDPLPVGGEPGHWLSDRMKAALAPQLLAALEAHEDVRVVTRATTWKHADVLLAVTSRRLLWIPAHAIKPEVSVLRHLEVEQVEHQIRRPLRRSAIVRLVTRAGARMEFADIPPDAAELITRNVQDGMPPALPRKPNEDRSAS